MKNRISYEDAHFHYHILQPTLYGYEEILNATEKLFRQV